MTRVDYEIPSDALKRYRKIRQLEKFARAAPGEVQRRIRSAATVAMALSVMFFAATILASFEAIIGMVPALIALAAAGVVVTVGLILGAVFFARPYSQMSKAELRGLEELRSRPGLRSMAEALDVAVESPEEATDW